MCLLSVYLLIGIQFHSFQFMLRAQSLSHVQFFVAPRTVAYQAPLPMGFPRQEYWSGLPFSSPGDLPKPGIEPRSPASPALAGGFFSTVLSELRALVWGYNHMGDRAHSLNSHKSALQANKRPYDVVTSLIVKNTDSLISTGLSSPKSHLLKEGLSGCLTHLPLLCTHTLYNIPLPCWLIFSL